MNLDLLFAEAMSRVQQGIDVRAQDAQRRVKAEAERLRRSMGQRWRYLEAELRK